MDRGVCAPLNLGKNLANPFAKSPVTIYKRNFVLDERNTKRFEPIHKKVK